MVRLVALLGILFTSALHAQDFDIYVSDAGNFDRPPWQIVKYDGDGSNPELFINQNLNWPQDILFLESRNEVLISNLGSGTINIHNGNSGLYKGNFASGIGGPTRMKIGPDNLLYVLQWTGNGKVKRYQLNGDFVDDFTETGVTQSIGLDWDKEGNLYISSYNTAQVRKFNQSGKDMGVFIASDLIGPTNIWFDAKGDLLVSDYRETAVKRFDSTGKYIGNFLRGLKNSEGVAYSPSGNILIGNGAGHNVRMYNAQGVYLEDVVKNGSGNLLTPNAVVVRLKKKTSIKENEKKVSTIISPNIGSVFNVSEDFKSQIDYLVIYNMSGTLLDIVDIKRTSVWNAVRVNEGIYLVKVLFSNGEKRSETVVVSK